MNSAGIIKTAAKEKRQKTRGSGAALSERADIGRSDVIGRRRLALDFPGNSLVVDDTLFSVLATGGQNAFGTTSTDTNIHSHYDDAAIAKVMGGNALRLLDDVWE